jgi:hypothetical protein
MNLAQNGLFQPVICRHFAWYDCLVQHTSYHANQGTCMTGLQCQTGVC